MSSSGQTNDNLIFAASPLMSVKRSDICYMYLVNKIRHMYLVKKIRHMLHVFKINFEIILTMITGFTLLCESGKELSFEG